MIEWKWRLLFRALAVIIRICVAGIYAPSVTDISSILKSLDDHS